jgi:metallophosphoesterase superfamily enzyme
MNNLKNLANKIKSEDKTRQISDAVAQILQEKGLSVDDIGEIKRISVWDTLTSDGSGGTETQRMTAIRFSPKWESGPEWPFVERAPIYQVPKSKTKVSRPKGWEEAVVVPDIQIGYYRKNIDNDNDLEPIHDESAIAVALKVIEDVQPNQIVFVGDNLDFAEFSKYLTTKPFKNLSQAAINRAAKLCAQVRAAAPKAKIHWIAGNHEYRMAKYIQMNAEAAAGLTVGQIDGDLRPKWPVLSVPVVCRMDEYGIDYVPGYPESFVSLNKNLMICHGHKVTSNGSTTTKYLNDAHISVIYGHIHRNEYAYRTRSSPDGPRTVMAASPGCLCRIDGAVPSTKQGVDEFGRPILQGTENWQQGLAIVQYQPSGVGNEWFNYEPMWIFNGRGFFRGKEYAA